MNANRLRESLPVLLKSQHKLAKLKIVQNIHFVHVNNSSYNLILNRSIHFINLCTMHFNVIINRFVNFYYIFLEVLYEIRKRH